jgi:hypothetical protein
VVPVKVAELNKEVVQHLQHTSGTQLEAPTNALASRDNCTTSTNNRLQRKNTAPTAYGGILQSCKLLLEIVRSG